MSEEDKRKLLARLRRLAGQLRALEGLLSTGEVVTVVTQFEAIVAASQASLAFYLQKTILTTDQLTVEERRLLARLIRKFS